MQDDSSTQTKNKLEFTNKKLQRMALTHSSFAAEHPELGGDNERLEFLGDSVLQLIITNFLYKGFPNSPEGELTSYRSGIVSKTVLAEIAEKIGINTYLRLGRSELREGGIKPNILADALEAFIGALFLDKGYKETEKFVVQFLLPSMEEVIKTKKWHNSKSDLQTKAQKLLKITPSYLVKNKIGPSDNITFEVNVMFGDKVIASGSGSSKKQAEQEAALEALKLKGWL